MEKVFKSYDTAGNPIYGNPSFLECDCNSTGGCPECNPFRPFWEEDIEMAEMRIDEYNEILKKEDND